MQIPSSFPEVVITNLGVLANHIHRACKHNKFDVEYWDDLRTRYLPRYLPRYAKAMAIPTDSGQINSHQPSTRPMFVFHFRPVL